MTRKSKGFHWKEGDGDGKKDDPHPKLYDEPPHMLVEGDETTEFPKYDDLPIHKRISTVVGREISVVEARSILSPILRGFQLRRVMGSEAELPKYRIGRGSAHMQSFTVKTVELESNQVQASKYFRVHPDCAEYLNIGFDQEAQQDRIDPLKHRRLWNTTLLMALHALPPRTDVMRLGRCFQQYGDTGMSMLFKSLVPKVVVVHGDRLAMAQTMVTFFPKPV